MKITFRIQYRTVWGESLCVLLSQNHIQHTVEMTTRNGEEWTGKAEFDFHPSEPICYRYAVSRQGSGQPATAALPHRRLLERSATRCLPLYIGFQQCIHAGTAFPLV